MAICIRAFDIFGKPPCVDSMYGNVFNKYSRHQTRFSTRLSYTQINRPQYGPIHYFKSSCICLLFDFLFGSICKWSYLSVFRVCYKHPIATTNNHVKCHHYGSVIVHYALVAILHSDTLSPFNGNGKYLDTVAISFLFYYFRLVTDKDQISLLHKFIIYLLKFRCVFIKFLIH